MFDGIVLNLPDGSRTVRRFVFADAHDSAPTAETSCTPTLALNADSRAVGILEAKIYVARQQPARRMGPHAWAAKRARDEDEPGAAGPSVKRERVKEENERTPVSGSALATAAGEVVATWAPASIEAIGVSHVATLRIRLLSARLYHTEEAVRV